VYIIYVYRERIERWRKARVFRVLVDSKIVAPYPNPFRYHRVAEFFIPPANDDNSNGVYSVPDLVLYGIVVGFSFKSSTA